MSANFSYDICQFILTTPASNAEIAHTFHVSKTTVRRYRHLLEAKEVTWLDLQHGGPSLVEELLHRGRSESRRKVTPDLAALDQALQAPHMTLQLWWERYRKADPRGALCYSHLAAKLAAYRNRLPTDMRQHHPPGEQMAVDYSGALAAYVDPDTGQSVPVQVFVGVLPHSALIFATCTLTQRVGDFLAAHVQMLKYFGGAPAMVVCDNLKSAVLKAGKSPVYQRSYLALAQHYSLLIRATRPRRPRDKAPVENAVRIVQQRILAQLNDETHHSLEALNARVRVLLEELNHRPMQAHGTSRWQRFAELEQASLRLLPAEPYAYAEWFTVSKVPRDYHIPVHGHFYSVPHTLIGERVDAKVGDGVLEVFHRRLKVAHHRLSSVVGGHSTNPSHQTDAHRSYASRSPQGLQAWAQSAGPHVLRFVQTQLDRTQPYLGLPACEKVQRLAAKHGTALLDRACADAIAMHSVKVTTVERLVARAAKAWHAPNGGHATERQPGARASHRAAGGQPRDAALGETAAPGRPAHVRGAAAIVGAKGVTRAR